jgi:prophage regulatory protein
MKVLRMPQLLEKVGMSRAWVYREIAAKRFPEPVALGPRARGWEESDVDAWVKNLGRGVTHGLIGRAK